MGLTELPDLCFSPIYQWVETDDFFCGKRRFENLHRLAVSRLGTIQPGHPDFVPFLQRFEGQYFVQVTAGVGMCLPKEAVAGHFVYLSRWRQFHQVQVQQLHELVSVLQGFREVESGIDEMHFLVWFYLAYQMQQCGGIVAKRSGY